MRGVICKIWNFLLGMLNDVTDTIAYALKTVGEVIVPVLGALGEVVGNTIGSIFGGSNLLIWAGVGILGYFLLTKQDDEDKSRSVLGNFAENRRTRQSDDLGDYYNA